MVATLRDASGTPVPDAYITIEGYGAQTGRLFGAGRTDAEGRYEIMLRPSRRVVFRARFDGSDLLAPAYSEPATLTPKALLSAPWTHGTIAFPGQRLPARGRLWPKHSRYNTGTVIVCERWESGTWVKRAQYKAKIVNTKTKSRYRSVIRLPNAGYWRVRAVHSDSGHARTLGPVTKIRVTDWRKRYWGKKLGGFKPPRKVVAITIDDGPNKRTPEICSILERYGARGTFFFTDQNLRLGYYTQARKAYDRGHEIANHTAHHKMLYGSYSACYSEVIVPKRSIRAATGFSPLWVRAMGGGIGSTGMRAVVNSGQLYCNWSLDSYDSHRGYTPPGTLYRTVINNVNSGDVILLHQTHPESVQALPAICRELKRRGYKMVTLSELAAISRSR